MTAAIFLATAASWPVIVMGLVPPRWRFALAGLSVQLSLVSLIYAIGGS